MYCFFTVIKLLMLKILLVAVTRLNASTTRYDYGYHSSAEEFDHLLHETRQTWTNSFLKAERERLVRRPIERHFKAAKTEAKYFVPRFQYGNSEKIKFTGYKPSPSANHDLQVTTAQQQNTKKPLQNIGPSSIELHFYSAELPNTPKQPTSQATNTATLMVSARPQIKLKPSKPPKVSRPFNYSSNTLYSDQSQAYFPIYFSNPATGIIYAITEVGKSTENVTKTNASIPIFIAKEQYERDIDQVKKLYQQKCENLRQTESQKPQTPVLAISSAHISAPTSATALPSPTPVIVQTELIVKDKKPSIVTRPVRKKNTKLKSKRKIKKQKAPGHKYLSTTIRTILENHADGPKIIIGTRTRAQLPLGNDEKLSTQLEKPNFEVFSGTALPYETKFTANPEQANLLTVVNSHKVNKRAVKQEWEISNETDNVNENYMKTNTKTYPREANLLNSYSKVTERNESRRAETLRNTFSRNWILTNSENGTETTKLVLQFRATDMPKIISKKLRKIFSENLVKQNISQNNVKTNSKSEVPNKTIQDFIIEEDRLKNNETLFKIPTIPAIRNTKYENQYKSQKLLNNETETAKVQQNFTRTVDNFQHSLQLLKNKKPSESKSKKFNFHNRTHPGQRSVLSDLKHHIKKRSPEVATTNKIMLPKFTKKSLEKNQSENTTKNINSTRPITTAETTKYRNTKLQGTSSDNGTHSTSNKHSATEANKSRATKLQDSAGAKRHSSTLKRNKSLRKVKTAAARTSKLGNNKKQSEKNKKMNKGKQDAEYSLFNFDANYEEIDDESDEAEDDYDDDEEDEDEDEEEEEEEEKEEYEHIDVEQVDYQDQNVMVSNDDDEAHTIEAGLSEEVVNEKTPQAISNSSAQESGSSVSEIEKLVLETAPLKHDNEHETPLKTKPTYVNQRFRRRPPQIKQNDDYEDDDDDDSISSHLAEFFRMLFTPIQEVMSRVMESFSAKDAAEDGPDFSTYTQYTPYHKYNEDYDSNEDSEGSSLTNWFSSWFPFNRRNKKIGSTTEGPLQLKPAKTKSSSWLPSWLSFGANDRISTDADSNEDYDEYDKWFASWFGEMKPKGRKRKTTTSTTTSTTTQIPHVPILTIVDPMKNPQNWIGILAHHIINQTASSTINPLKDVWNRATSTTTEDPEMPQKITYDKYQIWRLKPQDDGQVKALEEYKKSEDGIKLHWLKGPSSRGLTDVLVPPKMFVDFQASLTFELIDHEVLIFDVGKAIAYEKTKEDYLFTTTQKPKKQHGKNRPAIPSMTWHKYYEYDDIIKYLENMRMRFPHLVELIHIGRSYEGRPLIVMKIESKEAAAVNSIHYPAHQRNKLRHKKRIGLANAVFIEAGTHGLEWIGPATATWIINELLRIMKKNVTDDQSFIRNTTWYIMPVLNPDGYVYSHEYDRFWKKSRSRHISRSSGILSSAMDWLQKKRAKEKVCFGVDLDRNWHYQWGRRGSSKSVCNEFYAGPTPFSEPETKALSDFLMDYKTQIKLFVSMQSYGQIISYPYKANTTYDTERLDDLMDVAMVGTDGLRKKGSNSRYKVDSSNDLIENRSGCSDAFAAYEAGIPFSYTLQLADNGVHGFLLPSAAIESTAKDSFEIISGMLDYI